MKEITLLGTSHEIQRGERLSKEFNFLIFNEFKNSDFSSIAEEIDGGLDSIAKKICTEKKIKHLIVEPTPEEGCNMGIQQAHKIIYRVHNLYYDEIEKLGGWPRHPSEHNLPNKAWSEYSEDIEASYRAREAEWLKRLITMNKWPSLFICGAYHFTPFKKLLESSGIVVKVLHAHWDPELNE
jgi:hypothetical protein